MLKSTETIHSTIICNLRNFIAWSIFPIRKRLNCLLFSRCLPRELNKRALRGVAKKNFQFPHITQRHQPITEHAHEVNFNDRYFQSTLFNRSLNRNGKSRRVSLSLCFALINTVYAVLEWHLNHHLDPKIKRSEHTLCVECLSLYLVAMWMFQLKSYFECVNR